MENEHEFVTVSKEYLIEIEKKAKDSEYFRGRVDGMEYVIDSLDVLREEVRKYVDTADTPQTEVDDGEDYLRGYNDGYYVRGILDKAGVEIHIDKPRGFSLMSPSDKSQTDCPWK